MESSTSHDSHEIGEILTQDRCELVEAASLPVMMVLDRLRSAFNVGNIFRAVEAVRAMGIVACGYTAAPPHPKLQKTARGCDELVACSQADTSLEAVKALQKQNVRVYGVETTENAKCYTEVHFAFPAAFVMGNEALGVDSETLKQCDEVVMLPSRGMKNSINVGNCAAVMLYEALRQWQYGQGSERQQ